MQEELEVIKSYVESQGLHEKKGITKDDFQTLETNLRDADEFSLADYVKRLATPEALEDFIVNTLYG